MQVKNRALRHPFPVERWECGNTATFRGGKIGDLKERVVVRCKIRFKWQFQQARVEWIRDVRLPGKRLNQMLMVSYFVRVLCLLSKGN